jgi:hypothetical protein
MAAASNRDHPKWNDIALKLGFQVLHLFMALRLEGVSSIAAHQR